MRKLFAAALAATTVLGTAVAVSTPAGAQPWGYWRGPYHHRPYWGPHPYWGPRPYWGPYYGWGYRPYWRGYRPYRHPYGWRRW